MSLQILCCIAWIVYLPYIWCVDIGSYNVGGAANMGGIPDPYAQQQQGYGQPNMNMGGGYGSQGQDVNMNGGFAQPNMGGGFQPQGSGGGNTW